MKNYIVSEDELKRLLKDSATLTALEMGGVDNWEWYGESIADYEQRWGNIESVVQDELKDYDEIS